MTLTQIDNPRSIPLPPQGSELLQRMFMGYTRLIIEGELGGGFSLGRIFVVRAFKAERAELPAVIKIAPTPLIEKERLAYESHIHNRLPNSQNIQICTYSGDESLAGLRYPLAGGGIFEIESLYRYLARPDIELEQLTFTLQDRLLKSMGHLWRTNQAHPGYAIRGSYDRVLPVNLIIRPIETEATEPEPVSLTPQNIIKHGQLQPGDLVQLKGFIITQIESSDSQVEITLNYPPSRSDLPNSHRLRLLLDANGQPNPQRYQVDHEISIVGQVLDTRATQLQRLAEKGLGQEIDITRRELPLPEQAGSLPNPLLAYPDILSRSLDVRLAQTIHGDLNLENILVDPQTGDISLIDFADARRDYVLHDLMRLETGIITRLLPLTLAEANLPATTIHPLYLALHHHTSFAETNLNPALKKIFTILSIIRHHIRPYLFDYNDLAEYYQGLTLYLLGALKFNNLNATPTAKPAAFWGAATLVDLVQSPPVVKSSKSQLTTATPQPLPKRSIGLAIAGLLFILMLLAAGLWATRSLFSTPSTSGPLIATVIGFQPQVQYQTAGSNRLTPVDFGMDLHQGDILHTHQGASVDMACLNGLLLRLTEQRNMTIECVAEAAGAEVLGRLEEKFTTTLTNDSPASLEVLTSAQRGSRAEEDLIPRLIWPRNSVVIEQQPTFSWQPVENAEGYRLTLISSAGGSWTYETVETTLTYPPDEPPLTPGSNIIISVTPLNDPTGTAIDKTLLRVINETDLATVTEAEATLNTLNLDDTSRRFLLAQLYSQHEMWASAIEQLLPLTETQPSPNLWLHLATLYAQIELYVPAEAGYNQALTLAKQADNASAQADAHRGLAQTSAAFNDTEQAITHLQTAEALYRQVGQTASAEVVVGELEKLRLE